MHVQGGLEKVATIVEPSETDKDEAPQRSKRSPSKMNKTTPPVSTVGKGPAGCKDRSATIVMSRLATVGLS